MKLQLLCVVDVVANDGPTVVHCSAAYYDETTRVCHWHLCTCMQRMEGRHKMEQSCTWRMHCIAAVAVNIIRGTMSGSMDAIDIICK